MVRRGRRGLAVTGRRFGQPRKEVLPRADPGLGLLRVGRILPLFAEPAISCQKPIHRIGDLRVGPVERLDDDRRRIDKF